MVWGKEEEIVPHLREMGQILGGGGEDMDCLQRVN